MSDHVYDSKGNVVHWYVGRDDTPPEASDIMRQKVKAERARCGQVPVAPIRNGLWCGHPREAIRKDEAGAEYCSECSTTTQEVP